LSALDLEQDFSRARLGFAETVRAYYQLTKPNLSLLVVITGVLGYFLRAPMIDPVLLVHLIVGLFATSGGACATNMVIERDLDAKMRRTQGRPLPSGRIKPRPAMIFALGLFTLGFVELAVFTHLATALLAFATLILYAVVYTPMKKLGPVAIAIGAIPGAIPPVMGWAAVDGSMGAVAWALFALLFVWQFPHFLALAWMYREDYARGGFHFLAPDDVTGKKTARQMLVGSTLLVPVSLALPLLGAANLLYAGGATILGLWFQARTARMWTQPGMASARGTFFASIIYLPLLLALIVVDRWVFGP